MGLETAFIQHHHTTTMVEAERVAFVTSELPSKERWTEFTLWLTADNEWILQGVGASRVPGEINRYWTITSDDPADILQSIIGPDASRLAKKLIATALSNLKDCD